MKLRTSMPETYTLKRSQWVPRKLEDVFEFFSRAENLQELTPPWLNFEIVEPPEELRAGALIRYRLRVRGVPIGWVSEIREWDPPRSFVDVQVKGPYALWHHTHRFVEERGGTRIEDEVRYALPLGILGWVAHAVVVRRDIEKIFNFRGEKMRERFGE